MPTAQPKFLPVIFSVKPVVQDRLATLAEKFDVHPNQITQWRNQLLDGAVGVFDGEAKAAAPAPVIDVKTLHAKIGELALEND